MQSLLLETQRQMPAFGAQELSNLVWALAVLDTQPGAAWFRDFQVQVRGKRRWEEKVGGEGFLEMQSS